MDKTICISIIVVTGAVLLFYYFMNKGGRIERFYIRNDKQLFVMLQTSYFILLLSLSLNIRYIMGEWLEKFSNHT
jgi:hypothetical protein